VDAELARLANSKYLLLTTFRKDGTGVSTPVWVGQDGDALVFWSAVDTGKVRRLRRDDRVELAECDFHGKPSGASVKATAETLSSDDAARVRRMLARKYGLVGHLTFLGSRLRRGRDGTVCFAVTSTRG
jgi:PPOX class probable F420-dependent enzyme